MRLFADGLKMGIGNKFEANTGDGIKDLNMQ